MIVALLGTLACEQEERLRRKVKEPMTFVPLPDETPTARVGDALQGAAAIVTMKYDRSMPPAPRLGLLHVGGAGYDGIDLSYLPAGAAVCNAFGHDIPIAEYVMLAMLQWCTRFMEAERSFRVDGSWHLGGRTAGPYRDELAGKTVGILGFGQIGQALAPRAKAMDTTVLVSTRTARARPPGVDRMLGPEGLDEMLATADFLVICCALTPETDNLLDRSRLALMKRSAVIINVSRGSIVNEDALFEALRDRTIGGAILDAWYRYPTRDDLTVRPSRHPFHQLDNVYMTPHSSAWTLPMIERRWATIGANLDRFARGEPLENEVFRAR
jgi:phosphoglycerate dehydrogenase-like enzyme